MLTDDEEAANALIATIRILIERVMGRFKNAGTLALKWRHDIDFHRAVFSVQGHTINLAIRLSLLVKNPSKLLALDDEEEDPLALDDGVE